MSTARRTLRIPRHRAAGALPAARALVVCVLLAAAVSACSTHSASSGTTPRATPSGSSTEPPLGYRSLPAFLPTAAAPVDRVVTASTAHPQLAVQGVGVRVTIPAGTVLATVTGPHVPPFVSPPPPQVTAVFDVSLAHPASSVPVRATDFTITDQLGRTFHPAFVAHASRPPDTLAVGKTVTFQLTAAMPTGEGRIYWSPTGGSPIVGWDFIVEND